MTEIVGLLSVLAVDILRMVLAGLVATVTAVLTLAIVFLLGLCTLSCVAALFRKAPREPSV
jgi:hypothetical protein